jgi:hypothetical protein
MDDSPANPINEQILDEISQQDGQLGWPEIAIAVGAVTFEERSRVFTDLMQLEYSGIVRREQKAGRVRYWIGRTPDRLNRQVSGLD